MKKIFWGFIIIVLVLIVAGGIVASLYLGPIAKKTIETVGPKITQVSVKVDSVNLSLLTGSAAIEGLVVGNPEGYKAPEAIRVGSAAVGVNPLSVLSDKIVIRSVRVTSPQINFEGNPLSGNNLRTIMKNVNDSSKSSEPSPGGAPARTAAQPGKKLQVDDFLITGAKVKYNGVELPLPDIHLTNLGRGSEGITAADLTRRVLDALTTASVKAVANSVGDIGKSVENVGKDLGKSLGSGVSNVSKGLGNLFKK